MVESVEKFGTELQRRGFVTPQRDRSILHQGQVEIVHSRSADDSVRGIPEHSEGMIRETSGVEPAVDGAGAPTQIAVADPVGTVQVLPADV